MHFMIFHHSIAVQLVKEVSVLKKSLEDKIQASQAEQSKAKRLEETVTTLKRNTSAAGTDEVSVSFHSSVRSITW